jgi:hypothetical protein
LETVATVECMGWKCAGKQFFEFSTGTQLIISTVIFTSPRLKKWVYSTTYNIFIGRAQKNKLLWKLRHRWEIIFSWVLQKRNMNWGL